MLVLLLFQQEAEERRLLFQPAATLSATLWPAGSSARELLKRLIGCKAFLT